MAWNDSSISEYQQTLKKINQTVIVVDSFVSVTPLLNVLLLLLHIYLTFLCVIAE